MGSLWKSGKDSLQNGTILGIALGVVIVYGEKVYDWLVDIIPASITTFAGDYSIPIIIIGSGALLGYLLDKY